MASTAKRTEPYLRAKHRKGRIASRALLAESLNEF